MALKFGLVQKENLMTWVQEIQYLKKSEGEEGILGMDH